MAPSTKSSKFEQTKFQEIRCSTLRFANSLVAIEPRLESLIAFLADHVVDGRESRSLRQYSVGIESTDKIGTGFPLDYWCHVTRFHRCE